MNKFQMNLLSLLSQVGFAKVSKEQVREEIEWTHMENDLERVMRNRG